MRYKKIMILAILLVSLLAVSAVNAADNTTSDIVGVEETTDEVVSVEEDQVILENKNDGTFTELQNMINNTSSGSIITLEKDYTYDEGFSTDGINIDKKITIDGQGHTLNGLFQSRILSVDNTYNIDLILKNIKFKNGYSESDGGAIKIRSGVIVNTNAEYFQIINCEFDNNVADDGGAIYSDRSHIMIVDCAFNNNNASGYGGAITFADYSNIRSNVINCTFNDNHAYNGGAIYSNQERLTVKDSKFNNNRAKWNGGAIDIMHTYSYKPGEQSRYLGGHNSKIQTCEFNNNYASWKGGAIYLEADDCSLDSSIFKYNVADIGDAVYWNEYFSYIDGTIDNCTSYTTGSKENNLYIDLYYENPRIKVNEFDIILVKTNTNIVSSPVTAAYKESKYLVATLKDDKGNAISGAKISIDLNGIKTLTTDSKGQVKLSTSSLTPNTYTATIKFEGNDDYGPSSTTAKVTINKMDTTLTAKYDSASKNIVATVKDAKGNAVKGIKVGFAIDGVKYVTTDANGQAKYSTKGLAEKKYSVTVMAYNNDLYKDSNKATVTFDLNKIKTTLTAPNVVTTYNSGKNLVATLKDADGNAISGAKVKIKLGTTTKTLTTDKNGQVSMTTNGLDYNTYTSTITFAGDDTYSASNTTAKVTITKEKQKAKIYLRNALYFVLQTKMVQLTLWDANNNPIAGKTVYINLDEYEGFKYSGVTDENGNAYIRVGVGFGNHPATVSFEGDDTYNPDSKTGRVRVIKETPSLMLPGAYTKFKATDATKTIKVYLKDRYNKPLLPGTKVFVTINGLQYVGAIDEEGIASITINLNKAGVYNVDLYYTGNTAYNAVRKTTKITIV